MSGDFLLLQLADGSFPSGGYAHSGGLEAAVVLGGLAPGDVEGFLDRSLRQLGRGALPFVRAAAEDPSRLAALDEELDARSPLAGPNRASRAQGRALAGAAARVWDALAPVVEHAAHGPAHHAVIFGAVFGRLDVAPVPTLEAYLHAATRGILSAAVRLGLVGPLEAQRLRAERAPLLGAVVAGACRLSCEDAAQTAPLLEIFAALHDRLDGRMFQS
jgi:urease accessory protein